MKNLALFIFLINSIFCMEHFSNNFLLKKMEFSDDFSKIAEFTISNINKFFCSQKCNQNIDCSFFSFKEHQCLLYSADGRNDLVASNQSIIYEKKGYESKNTQENSITFTMQSTSTSNSVSCPPGFVQYSSYPKSCYYYYNSVKQFLAALSHCKTNKSFLLRPKTAGEQKFFGNLYSNSVIWVDSYRVLLIQNFRWGDDTLVNGFGAKQPDNGGEKKYVKEGALVLSKSKIHDRSMLDNNEFVCQFDL